MKLNLAIVAIAVTTSICGPAYGEATVPEAHDGNLWRALPRELKIVYIKGLIDGSALGVMLSRESLPKSDPCREKYIPSLQSAFKREFEGVNPDQIADGVDAIFKDYRNRSLLITDAVAVTLEAVKGMSPANIETLLQHLRRLK